MAIRRNEVAAYFHARMAYDSRFGYTQGAGRWGSGALEIWECQGVKGQFLVGDRDCSSSVIDCWCQALRGSAWEGALNGATYTGDMLPVFVNSGLFDWHPMNDGYIAKKGDIYLNVLNHTAMCQSDNPDVLTEACINEWGGIVGGMVGDQTGGEFHERTYYDFPWDGILAYNHKADVDEKPKAWALCMWSSNGGDNQRFSIVDDGDENGVMLICKADGRAVDVSYSDAKNGAEVILYEKHGRANQRWRFTDKENGTYEIVSALDDKKCLDVVGAAEYDGAKLCIWNRHGGANQEWIALENRDGTYTLINNGLGRKMVLDCVGGGK